MLLKYIALLIGAHISFSSAKPGKIQWFSAPYSCMGSTSNFPPTCVGRQISIQHKIAMPLILLVFMFAPYDGSSASCFRVTLTKKKMEYNGYYYIYHENVHLDQILLIKNDTNKTCMQNQQGLTKAGAGQDA